MNHQEGEPRDHGSTDRKGSSSWWAAKPLVSDGTDPIFSLFEFFPRNAEPYAQLRVSISNGTHAYYGFFAHDALFPLYSNSSKTFPSHRSPSGTMRDVIDGVTPGVLRTENFGSENDPVVIVESSHLRSPISLHLSHQEPIDSFLQRVTDYFNHLNHKLCELQHETNEKARLRDELAKTLDESVSQKVSFDQQLIQGTTILMIEKEKHRKSRTP